MAWYVVYRGRVLGVYSSWAMCNAQVTGFPNNCHQSFATMEEAEASYLEFTGGNVVPLLENAPPVEQLVEAEAEVFFKTPCFFAACVVLCVILLLVFVLLSLKASQ